MQFQLLTLFIVLALFAGAQASENELVEKWTASMTSRFATALRAGVSDGLYGEKFAGPDQDKLIAQISKEVVTCWANAHVRLAKKHSISLDDVFVGPDGGEIDDNMFGLEINEETRNCGRNAFNNAGIEFD